jgi:hypothetical protein
MGDFNWVLLYVLIFMLVAGVVSAIFIYKRVQLNARQLILGSSILVGLGVITLACLHIPFASMISTYSLIFENDANLVNLFIIGFILLQLMVVCSAFGFWRFWKKIRAESYNVEEGRVYVEKKFIVATALLGLWLVLLFTFYYWDFWSHTPYTNFDHINDLFQTYYPGVSGAPFSSFIYLLIIVFSVSQGLYIAGPPLLSELMHQFEKTEEKSKITPLPTSRVVDDADFEDFVDHLPFEAYSGDKPYIFVSYSHRDKELVYPVITRLFREGVRIWYDEGIPPSGKWIEQIANTLKKCEMFIIFITLNAVSSKHVRNEIYFANKNDKKIFPIYLTKTTLPDELDIQIGRFQALFKYRMSEKIFWKKLLEQFVIVRNVQ